MDKCDCCGAEMKHIRVGKPLFACDDCQEVAVARLGHDVTYVQIGIKK